LDPSASLLLLLTSVLMAQQQQQQQQSPHKRNPLSVCVYCIIRRIMIELWVLTLINFVRKERKKLKRVYEFDILFFFFLFSVIWLFLKDLLNTAITGLLDIKCFFSPFYVFNNCADLSTFFFFFFLELILQIYIFFIICYCCVVNYLIFDFVLFFSFFLLINDYQQ
jgi:hypothetical protein